MYLQRLAVLADELRALSSARPHTLAAVETRYSVSVGRYPSVSVQAVSNEETKIVLSSLIRELGYEGPGEGVGLTIVRRGLPAMITILLPESSSRVLLRASRTASRLGLGGTGSAILDISRALLGDREAAGAVALSILLETMADRRVADVVDELGRIRETLSGAASEVRSL
jgi:hypothetical protein